MWLKATGALKIVIELLRYFDTNYHFKISVNNGYFSRFLFACFGEPNERMPDAVKPLKVDESPARESAELAFCFAGLMGAYLVWGLLQEKIMTQVRLTRTLNKTAVALAP